MTEIDAALVRRKLSVIVRFIRLGREGVIPAELGEALAPAAGLRNRLVHEYDAIDDEIVLAAVADARRDFRTFVEDVERHLAEQGF